MSQNNYIYEYGIIYYVIYVQNYSTSKVKDQNYYCAYI